MTALRWCITAADSDRSVPDRLIHYAQRREAERAHRASSITEQARSIVIKVVGLVLLIIVIVIVALVALLRWRKLRRDDLLAALHHSDTFFPPPAPYEVSRGIRLLDDGDVPLTRAEPQRPRLDPERQYVFSDVGPIDSSASYLTRSKHNERWALERSSHGPRVTAASGRVIAIVVVALGILIGIGAYLQSSPAHAPHTTTTSTTTTTGR